MFHYFTKWFSDKANTNFYSLTVLEKATESESFAIISIDPLVAHKKILLSITFKQLCLQTKDYLDDNCFKSDEY